MLLRKRFPEEPENLAETLLEISDPRDEGRGGGRQKRRWRPWRGEPGIIATSPAVAEICDRLELDLIGICSSSSDLPERYRELPQIGTAMAPDMELVASLDPDWILSPSSLQSDLQPKYEAIDTDWAFLNLRSVPGMYRSIQELGEIFGREEQARAMVEEFTEFYQEYQTRNEGKEAPKVLVLMGLPGSYIIATENSYVGSLVELAGGEKCLCRYGSGISYGKHGRYEDQRAGRDPLRRPCPAGSGYGDVSGRTLKPMISGSIFRRCRKTGFITCLTNCSV